MLIDEILKLESEAQVAELKKGKRVALPEIEKLKKQWNPKDHDVMDPAKRPDRIVKRKTVNRDTGVESEILAVEPVTRIAVSFQKLIVKRAAGFLFGNPVTLKTTIDEDKPAQAELVKMVEETLRDNKVKYLDRKLARILKSECEVAELWFPVEDKAFWGTRLKKATKAAFKLRVQILSPGKGDALFPYFDETGNMTAFSREYRVDEGGKPILHFDTWTETQSIKRVKRGDAWEVTPTPNQFKKIPVIYYQQDEPDWLDAQPMIDRYEKKISNFGDTNDYFGAPMVKVKGTVKSMPEKTSSGKLIQLEADSDAEYMSWPYAPEAEKLEFEILEKQIYSTTQTPNISFDQMKGLGGEMSGFAIKLLFTDAHLKAENDIEIFGEMYQRRLNFLKAALGGVINTALAGEVDNVEIEPEFTPYLPKNVKETIEMLVAARGNKPLISNETALENNPLIDDTKMELERMKADQEEELANQQRELTGTFE